MKKKCLLKTLLIGGALVGIGVAAKTLYDTMKELGSLELYDLDKESEYALYDDEELNKD